MESRRNERGLVGAHLWGHPHKGVDLLELEKLRRPLLKNGGSERTKGLAMLHAGVDAILHCFVPGIGQDGAISKCAWAKLGSPLEPGHDLAGGNVLGNGR